ncbi:2,4-dienoyl-CoA reductase [Anaerobranca californiensis DSM 14826]|jgi:2,4-dienoyl-CoA reductase-like NADH-dependent reductase (Old Yellow Enzyme family)|uniref:2,4-dienoyl-CoA reductase n=1 Tax=Anaerobranca californiensis DSM 14826 TaxID=1120989 RepID=A0A1M6M5C8_9FIRM|nr:NADH:flavin oxidoreductase [Anaerobranca californiensis]SHJ78648.1 2,4-dienoyl-CoA reductase [Anaerobranca californiensis DSM 14826]
MASVIDKPILINGKEVKNRILMPPLVCFNWADDDGFETVDRQRHYGLRAQGGTGLIVVEAAAVSKEGRLAASQLGIWKDEHIPQFAKIAQECHKHGAKVVVQLVHAGMKSVGDKVFVPSPIKTEENSKEYTPMTLEDIQKLKEDFINAAIRAQKAGLDGVEVHGAHSYLLNQFTSPLINKRDDLYGGTMENRFRLPLEIVQEIRKACGQDFIISYRFGVNDPTFAEDKHLAQQLEKLGVNILNVSNGIGIKNLEVPQDFPFSFITYMGVELRKAVNIPVACVFGIREPKEAEYLLEKDLIDMVAVGRALLADPNWTNKAIKGEAINLCYHCKPRCKYSVDGHTCPWFKTLNF